MLSQYFTALLDISLEAAPWLLLGLLVAGFIKSFMPQSWIEKQLKPAKFSSVIKSVLFGIPLPLCSCSVMPVALSLKRNGASPAATTSFLVSTPTTGVDSIIVSYALLGPLLAIVRPIAAGVTGLLAGVLCLFIKDVPNAQVNSTSACCKTKCCGSKTSTPAKPDFMQKVISGLRYAVTDLYLDIIKWLIVGLLVAAAIQAFVPSNWFAQWGQGIFAMLAAILVGLPMYICATASTPLAATLLLAGVSPGTVLVFLLAGPACNIGTLGLIQKEMGNKILMAYLTAIIVGSISFGLALDYFIPDFTAYLPDDTLLHQHGLNMISLISLVGLIILAFKPFSWTIWSVTKQN